MRENLCYFLWWGFLVVCYIGEVFVCYYYVEYGQLVGYFVYSNLEQIWESFWMCTFRGFYIMGCVGEDFQCGLCFVV